MKLSLVTALNAVMLDLNDKDLPPQATVLYRAPSIPADGDLPVIINRVSSIDISRFMQIIISTVDVMGGFTVSPTDVSRQLTHLFTRINTRQKCIMCVNTVSGNRLVYMVDADRGYKDIDLETCVMSDAAFTAREDSIIQHHVAVDRFSEHAQFILDYPGYPMKSWGLTPNAGIHFTEPHYHKCNGWHVIPMCRNTLFGVNEDTPEPVTVYGCGLTVFDKALDAMISRLCNSKDDVVVVTKAIGDLLSTMPRTSSTVSYNTHVINAIDGNYTFYMRCYPDGFSEMILLEDVSSELHTAIINSINPIT